MRRRTGVYALCFIVLLVFIAMFPGLVAPINPNFQNLSHSLSGISTTHWLGTDRFGRDIFSRLVFGTRVALVAASQAVLVALLLGTPAGLFAGFVGRWLDGMLSRVADLLLSLPPLILALAIIGILGPGLTNAMIAIGIVFAPRFFRIARGSAQSVQGELYIEAARSVGCSTFRTLWRHVLPNASGPLLVQTTFTVGLAITAEASLSFLGLGVQDPRPDWGGMTQQAFETVRTNIWPIVPPTVMIVLSILAFSLLGDGLRDALGRSRQNA